MKILLILLTSAAFALADDYQIGQIRAQAEKLTALYKEFYLKRHPNENHADWISLPKEVNALWAEVARLEKEKEEAEWQALLKQADK